MQRRETWNSHSENSAQTSQEEKKRLFQIQTVTDEDEDWEPVFGWTTWRSLVFLVKAVSMESCVLELASSESDWGFSMARRQNAAVPNFTTAGPISWKKISLRVGVGNGFRMIQVYYVYCALYLNYYYISSILDHQALDPRGWGYSRSSLLM